eukprot:1159199-Pelagomonas_calceolata.AAC.6
MELRAQKARWAALKAQKMSLKVWKIPERKELPFSYERHKRPRWLITFSSHQARQHILSDLKILKALSL